METPCSTNHLIHPSQLTPASQNLWLTSHQMFSSNQKCPKSFTKPTQTYHIQIVSPHALSSSKRSFQNSVRLKKSLRISPVLMSQKLSCSRAWCTLLTSSATFTRHSTKALWWARAPRFRLRTLTWSPFPRRWLCLFSVTQLDLHSNLETLSSSRAFSQETLASALSWAEWSVKACWNKLLRAFRKHHTKKLPKMWPPNWKLCLVHAPKSLLSPLMSQRVKITFHHQFLLRVKSRLNYLAGLAVMTQLPGQLRFKID